MFDFEKANAHIVHVRISQYQHSFCTFQLTSLVCKPHVVLEAVKCTDLKTQIVTTGDD